ncbi:putative ring finger-like protein [Phaeoacremonium minimum UCRPA7]|uniref:Putative ring finger-like protein n=1 Tax=Phaeoacremonium minimum (strain UCR-PA7) TaxID=1286976 RepID=R8BQR7_PHAM7|nr:putative ring finger-like protein [Phaeoacremonium minimum UCRPA7]EOO01723.1 putative ring finger-like protein [Phaeoacremonium minimum UCRPA7]
MAATKCKACENDLILQVHEDEDDPSSETLSFPDDLELPCGCHFHWQCVMDDAAQIAVSLKCPSCDAYLPANQAGPSATNTVFHVSQGQRIPARYTSEGGVQDNYDILPEITEEAYLEAHPEARPARAFHVMCAEGDVGGVVDLLKGAAEEGADPDAILRYQDPLSENKSALHLAVEKQQEEIVWLLLWLASSLHESNFPAEAIAAAQAMGVEQRGSGSDIRLLKDSEGRNAKEYALRVGGRLGALAETLG